MAFPPLVSSTPPPLDNLGDDDDDEFGDFTAGGIDGHSTASDSPMKHVTPILTPISSQTGSPKINGYSPTVKKQNDSKSNFLFESTLDNEILRVRKLEGIVSDIELDTRPHTESVNDINSEDCLRYNNLPISHNTDCTKPEINSPITDRVPEITHSITSTFNESQFGNDDHFADNVRNIGHDSEKENDPDSLNLVLDDSLKLSEISQTVEHDFYDHRNTQHLRHNEKTDAFDVDNLVLRENSRMSLPLNTNYIEGSVQSNEIDMVDASTFQYDITSKILATEPTTDSMLDLSKFVISDETDLESANTLGSTQIESHFDVQRDMWRQGDDGATISKNSEIHSKMNDPTSITLETDTKVQEKSNVAANFVNEMENYDTSCINESNVMDINDFQSFELEKEIEKSKITPNEDIQTLQPNNSIPNCVDTVLMNSTSSTHVECNSIVSDIGENEFDPSTGNEELKIHVFNNEVPNLCEKLGFDHQFPSAKTSEPTTVDENSKQSGILSKSTDNVSFDNISRRVHLDNYNNTISTSEDELKNANELRTKDSTGDDVAVHFAIRSEKSRESEDCVNVVSDTRTVTEVPRQPNTDVTTADFEDDFDEFGDFADFASAPVPIPTDLKCESENLKPLGDENFGDFGDFKSSSSIPQSSNELVRESIARVENESAVNKIEDIIKNMFPITSQTKVLESKDECQISNNIWDEVKSIEETNALLYHWSNSTSNNLLLSALGIDSRNILFGPRWNHNIPRFAANLGFTPLEPVRASIDSQQSATPNGKLHGSPTSEEVPAAQFDWNSSGLVNPLGANSADHSTRHGEVNTQHLSDPFDSPLKPSKSLQPAKLIEPLPGPSQVEWNKKTDPEFVGKRKQDPPEKSLRNISQMNSKQFSMGISEVKSDFARGESSKSESARTERHKKSSINKREILHQEQMVLDRFGRPMAVREETVKVLKQLPDLSFLSARTLMFNPEQKQIVQDLGAMINRKMPG